MRNAIFLCLTLLAFPVIAAERPNIIFILVDDLGQRDLGCYGSSFYETVNVDRLAQQGARFTDAYTACPVCSPTRASIMTGKWPQRVGITDYIGAVSDPTKWKRDTVLLPAPYHERLELDQPTLAKSLKGAGYATFFAGKWHLGPEGYWPEKQGFDVNQGGIDRGGPYGGKKYFSPYGNPRLSDGPDGEHLPDRLASEACRFIEQHREDPFFVYLSFYSVHTPLISREDLRDKYEAKRQRLGLENEWGQEGERKVRLVQEHAIYAGMVEAMDLAVGKVLDQLDALGLSDDTLVVFTSDNGGLSTSEGWPTSNLPLRGGKGWMYEGGIRVPLVVRWPGHVAAGTEYSTPVSSPDFFPTLMDAAGVHGEASEQAVEPDISSETSEQEQSPTEADGLSLLPLFHGESFPDERPLFWHYPHYGNQGGAPSSAIRRGRYKLIEWYEDGRLELFDLQEDLSEQHDLADAQPELKQELHAQLHTWLDDVGALYPSKR